jgi:phage tail-like protein
MAEFRERPYSQFNFLVSFDQSDPNTPEGGFQEVTGLGMEVTVAEYRAGNSALNSPLKITGTYKVPDVTLKRGVIGSTSFYEWLQSVRNGKQDDLRAVTITLLSEDRETEAVKWRLVNARPMKYTGPSFNGKGTDLAIEELVLACEDIRYDGEQ